MELSVHQVESVKFRQYLVEEGNFWVFVVEFRSKDTGFGEVKFFLDKTPMVFNEITFSIPQKGGEKDDKKDK